jgi:hypothetical protein
MTTEELHSKAIEAVREGCNRLRSIAARMQLGDDRKVDRILQRLRKQKRLRWSAKAGWVVVP